MRGCCGAMTPLGLLLVLVAGAAAEDEWFVCTPGITNSVGVSYPRGDIFLQNGSESIDLYCHLNPQHAYFKKGYSSSDLSFEIKGKGEFQKIILEKTKLETKILNETSIRSTFDPHMVGFFDVKCLVDISKDDIERGDEEDGTIASDIVQKGVCRQMIHVGYAPLDVEDFSCVSENWENLNCTWTEPWNPVRTEYDVHFKEPGRTSPIKNCPSRSELEIMLKRNIDREPKQCYVDQKTHPQYRQAASKFTFLFNATSPLKPSGKISIHKVNHLEIVRPGPPRDLLLKPLSASSLRLSYSVPSQMREFPAGLVQAVTISSEHQPDTWTSLDTNISREHQKNDSFTIVAAGLAYAWTNYTARVQMLSAKADPGRAELWSQPVFVTGTTLPARPGHPPRTCPASFEVTRYPSSRDVQVYWSRTEPRYHNGPNFTYEVVRVLEDGEVAAAAPETMTSSSATFPGLAYNSTFSFSVSSRNSLGPAPSASEVFVPSQEVIDSLSPRSVTAIYRENSDQMEVSWSRPPSHSGVKSYTIFWCSRKNHFIKDCEGVLDFATVSPDIVEEDTEEAKVSKVAESSEYEDTLIYSIRGLDPALVYRLGVAANADSVVSSGLQWSSCTIVNREMRDGWVRELSVGASGAEWLQVGWSLPCSERSSVVLGYNLTWCSEEEECGHALVTHSAHSGVRHNLTGLRPWTEYSLQVTPVGPDTVPGQGTPSPATTIRTRAAAPGSPPTALQQEAVTNTSATISWDTPVVANGPVSSYRVWLRSAADSALVTNPEQVSSPRAVFSALRPYTEYVAAVTACNQLHGAAVCGHGPDTEAEISFRTEVGSPGKPLPPAAKSLNNSIYTVLWSTDFPLGGPEEDLQWTVRVVSEEGEVAELAVDTPTLNTRGQVELELDFEQLDMDSSWVQTCENSSLVPVYNVSVRAALRTPAAVLTGPWSEVFSLQPTCQPAVEYWKIILMVVGASLAFLIVIGGLIHSIRYAKKQKDYFKDLGMELESKYIPITRADTNKNDISRHYIPKMDGKFMKSSNDSSNDDQKDLMQTLLDREKSKESDTTSGCETGGGSGTGTSLNSLQRCRSSDSTGSSGAQVEAEAGDGGYLQLAAPGPAPANGYINTEVEAAPVSKPAPGYIQLPAASGPPPGPATGYIQIQNVADMFGGGPPPAPPPGTQELVHSDENPFYSKVNIRLELEAEAEPAAKASPGYIQLPASASPAVTLSPHKLGTGASPRALEPHNTRV